MKKYQIIDLSIPKGAIFSDDRQYRYALWRVWNPKKLILGCVGLNPSDANELKNDPTIARGIVRASLSGFGGFIMVNMHGLVSSNPDSLLNNPDAVGELNDYYIRQMVKLTERQLCGWGSFKPVKYRAKVVYQMLPNPYCLAVNADGNPKHPLYVSYDTPMVKYCWGSEVESDIDLVDYQTGA